MDLKWPRVARRSNVGLVKNCDTKLQPHHPGANEITAVISASWSAGAVMTNFQTGPWRVSIPHTYTKNMIIWLKEYYRQVSDISRTFVGNKIVDHSDVVGASPVGAAPTTSSFST